MKMHSKLIAAALVLGASVWIATAQDDAGGPPPAGARPVKREAGPGGPGGQAGAQGFRVLPPFIVQQLNLTDEQKKQIKELEAEVKAKIEKILTAEQLQQLKQMRPPMRQGAPGMGGPRMGGPGMGGPGGQGGPPPEDGPNGPGQPGPGE